MLRPEVHWASTSFLHCSLSLAFLSSSLYVWPISFISDSTVLLQVVLSFTFSVHLRDTLVMLFVGFLSTCPIHRQRFFLRIAHMLVELVISCRFSFEILTGQNILSILFRQPFWKIESYLMSFSVILQHSAPYNRTSRTQLLYSLILVFLFMLVDFQMFFSLVNLLFSLISH